MVLIVGQYLDATPAPVDPVGADEAVFDLHHFDEVHLLTGRGVPRIFPHHPMPVSEKATAVVVPLVGSSGDYRGNQPAKLVMATADATPAQEVSGHGAF